MISGKVSIITATYNRPKLLLETLEVVQQQTYQNWEHLVISDGYDYRVQRLVKQLGDPRVSYYFTDHFGYWGNLPKRVGVKRANGEYVLYLDDDNIIYPNYLEVMVKAFAPMVGYAVCQIRHHNGRILAPALPLKEGEIDLLNYMVRRSVLEACGGFPNTEKKASDFVFIKQVEPMAEGVFVPEVLGEHRRLPGGCSCEIPRWAWTGNRIIALMNQHRRLF